MLIFRSGDDGGNLHRPEKRVVQITLQPRKSCEHRRISDPNPLASPACYSFSIGEKKLNANILGSLGLEKTGRPISVEDNIAIGEVIELP